MALCDGIEINGTLYVPLADLQRVLDRCEAPGDDTSTWDSRLAGLSHERDTYRLVKSEWKNTPPDEEGWWWLFHPQDQWNIPTSYYFRPSSTRAEKASGDFVSDGPGTPFTGWGEGWQCCRMPGPPMGWSRNPPRVIPPPRLFSAWEKFYAGDHLSDEELAVLVEDARQGIKFLEARGETGGVLFKARLDLESLETFQHNRQIGR